MRVDDNNRIAMNMMGLTNSGDKRGGVDARVADADGIGLARDIGGSSVAGIEIADVDVAIARGEIKTG